MQKHTPPVYFNFTPIKISPLALMCQPNKPQID